MRARSRRLQPCRGPLGYAVRRNRQPFRELLAFRESGLPGMRFPAHVSWRLPAKPDESAGSAVERELRVLPEVRTADSSVSHGTPQRYAVYDGARHAAI